MKDMEFSFEFTDDDYSLIKSEYKISSGYIHGGNILNNSLVSVLDECLDDKVLIKDINKYHNKIKKIFRVYDKMLISQYGEYISSCFHRRKTIFEYLLGKECLELLFSVTNYGKRDFVKMK